MEDAVETMAFNCGKVMVLGVLVGPPRNDFTQRLASNYVFQNAPKKKAYPQTETSQFHESHGNPSPQPLRTTAPSNSLRLLRPSRTFTWTNVMAQPGRISAPGGGRWKSTPTPKISKDLHEIREVGNISWHIPNSQLDAVGCRAKMLGQDLLIPIFCHQIHKSIMPSQHPMADRTGSRHPRSLATWCRPRPHREHPGGRAAARDHPGVPGTPPAMCHLRLKNLAL